MNQSTPIDLVLERLEQRQLSPKRNGAGYAARCPAHDDRAPSLGVTEGDDGRALILCRAGCDTGAVLVALDLKPADLFAHANGNGRQRAEIVATYDYVDRTGKLLFQTVRMAPKDFRQRRPDGAGGWAWNLQGVDRVLYRLPEVLDAIAAGLDVVIVEGEKDADRLAALDVTATCNPMGAGKWRPEHTETLRRANVVIVADRDDPGRAHARAIAQALDGVAASVRCAEPAAGKDVSDHLDAGHTEDELVEIDDAWATPIEPPPNDYAPSDEVPSYLDIFRARLVRGVDAIRCIPARRPLVTDVLDLDSFAVEYGRPGSAKSFLAIDIGLHVATGSWWHGHRVRQGPVLYLVAEGSGGIAARVNAWTIQNRYCGAGDDFIVLPCAVNLLDVIQAHALATIADELAPVLVVIDTLNRSMAGGDENTSRDMGLVIAGADAIRTATGACVLLVHHSGKDTSAGARGHSSLLGAVDTELEVKKADGIITFNTTKQKDHADGNDPMRFVLVPHTWACPARCEGAKDCDTCGGKGTVGSAAIARHAGSAPTGELDQKALDALAALEAVDVPGGVANGVWLEAAMSESSVRSPMVRSTFFEKRRTLIDAKKVRQIGEGRAARYTLATRDNAE